MQAKCQICHRSGDIAPFALATYADASARAGAIKQAVSDRRMPPWKPVPGHGEFRDSYALTDDERATLIDWVEAGVPEGDPSELPEARPYTGEWHLGEPDHVVQMPAPYEVPRRHDTYRCFVIPTGLNVDRFVTAAQVIPGNRQIVHHVILFIDTTGQADKLDAQDAEPGYNCFGGPGIRGVNALTDLMSGLGGWVPGARTQLLPEGVAMFLSERAKIVMQVHYHPAGRPGGDQTKVGLYFAKDAPERRLRYIPIVNFTFRIPPGDPNYDVRALLPMLPFTDAKLIQIVPHMHMLGKKIQVTAQRGGVERSLIYIDDWDFHWQGFYTYVEPVPITSGTTLRLTCTFDNSAENPRNPHNPPRTVTWGEGSEDEMCVAFLGVTFDNENLLPFLSIFQRP
jgi:hypothetical protein